MPREQLKALAADVDRLLVAGAGSISGDEGLRRREQSLRDLGKKVPALAKVADVVGQAVAADATKAPRALLELLLVVGQVRAGLATAGVEGTIEPPPPSGPWGSDRQARDLYPLADVLTRVGSGRIEILKGALGGRELGDLRLFDLLLDGLDDPSAEFADLVAAEALPTIGRAALPDLLDGLDMQGKAADARRLTAIASIDPAEGLAACHKAIAEGNAAMKVRALEALAATNPEEGAAIALELLAPLETAGGTEAGPEAPPVKGKKAAKSVPRSKLDKKVRDAAIAVLGWSMRDEALDALIRAFSRENHPEFVDIPTLDNALIRSPHPEATARLLRDLEALVEETTHSGKRPSKGSPAPGALINEIHPSDTRRARILQILGARGDLAAVPALIRLLANRSLAIRNASAQALIRLRDPAGVLATSALVEDPKTVIYGIEAAWLLPSEAHFERLSPLLRGSSDPARGGALISRFYIDTMQDGRRTDWDPRWAKALRPHLDGDQAQYVALALEMLAGAEAVPDLIRALKPSYRDWGPVPRIIAALGKYRDRRATGPLIEQLIAYPNLQGHICSALKAIDDPSMLPTLKAKVGTVQEKNRRTLLDRAIASLS